MLIHMDTLLLGAPVFISIHLMLMLITLRFCLWLRGKISIHLMLMLILLKTLLNCSLLYFNTSHVNVNPDPMQNIIGVSIVFQYISC